MTTPDAAQHPVSVSANSSSDSSPVWYLKLSETWHSMSQVLGLKRLQELIQGSTSLSNEPAWLLGLWYGLHNKDDNMQSLPEEMQQALLEDFSSKFWFTYRRDFQPMGLTGLTSDVGWGCTIRSGQMLMGEALARCWWGRITRLPRAAVHTDRQWTPRSAAVHPQPSKHSSDTAAAQNVAELTASGLAVESPTGGASGELQLLQLFVDELGPSAPLSLHNICKAGEPHGVVVGQWLGPWVLCKALAAAAHAQHGPQQQRPCLGLQVHVVCDPGGGAPTFELDKLRALMAGSNISEQQPCLSSPSKTSGKVAEEGQQPGLLILVPLTLGVGKVNELYLPQLSAVLTFPQSVGIVGGRPGSSLYFLGVQGNAVMYLDPHEVQQAPVLPDDAATFHCCAPRLMPLTSIDPSLAIGFYCKTTDELRDLSVRLQKLIEIAGGAPLMTVVIGDCQQQQQRQSIGLEGHYGDAPRAASSVEDWELV